jgi:hypothetical protein
MKRINTNPVSVKEFEGYTLKIAGALGDDVSSFFYRYP